MTEWQWINLSAISTWSDDHGYDYSEPVFYYIEGVVKRGGTMQGCGLKSPTMKIMH